MIIQKLTHGHCRCIQLIKHCSVFHGAWVQVALQMHYAVRPKIKYICAIITLLPYGAASIQYSTVQCSMHSII